MAEFVRQALQYTHQGLTSLNRKMGNLLNGGSAAQRVPIVKDLSEAYARGWRDCPCVFVLSTGRVGTKTLATLLALSPWVKATHEPEPRLVKASFDAFMEGGDLGKSEKWREVIFAARDDAVCSANRRGKIYLETNPKLSCLATALAACFPASQFIHLHRHPYEVVRSAMRRGHYQGHSWDFARIRPPMDEPLADEWESLSPVEKSAWRWARINSDALAFLRALPESRKFNLPADALFSADEQTLVQLFAFIGADLPPKNRLEDVLGQRINAQKKGEFPLPSEWSERDRQAVQGRVAGVARELGYEL
jgi:hypothetical protein